MKAILFALLLSLAPQLNAQEIVPLGAPDWWDDRLSPGAATYEDGQCAKFFIIQSDQLPNINWDLEKADAAGNIIAPDSIVFIVEGLAEVYGFSGWSDGDYLVLGHTSASGRISFPYSVIKGAPHFRVGIAAHPKRVDKTANLGGKCIDAAYAVYGTAPSMSVRRDSAMNAEEAIAREELAQEPRWWHIITGARYVKATSSQLEAMAPPVNLYGWKGLNWDPLFQTIYWRKSPIRIR